MEQADDFKAESDALNTLLREVAPEDWSRETQFKGWTLNDVVVHLHFFNELADLSLVDPDGFAARMPGILPRFQSEGMRAVQSAEVTERGEDLRAAWEVLYTDMGTRWAALDPRRRVKWVGPEMSVRSSITARQMETWAHGQEVFDLLGKTRSEADRIRNIVMLGINTFGWTYHVNGRTPPDLMPHLVLTAPSGAVWTFGEAQQDDVIEGAAVEFAQVVAQTRNIADTALRVRGPVAGEWMSIAQCFAGGPQTPPAPGTRFRDGA